MIVTKFGWNPIHSFGVETILRSVARKKEERKKKETRQKQNLAEVIGKVTRAFCALRARTFGINIFLIKGDNFTFDHFGNDRLTGNNDHFDFLFKTNNLTP